jgi:hypothetical protein
MFAGALISAGKGKNEKASTQFPNVNTHQIPLSRPPAPMLVNKEVEMTASYFSEFTNVAKYLLSSLLLFQHNASFSVVILDNGVFSPLFS